jgi:undecaprenyl-diphosphatase
MPRWEGIALERGEGGAGVGEGVDADAEPGHAVAAEDAIAGDLLSFTGEKAKLFEVFIQLGAILAVVWAYRDRIFALLRRLRTDPASRRFAVSLIIAFTPAAAVGFLTHKYIKQYLFNTVTVSVALIVGGIVILLIERMRHTNRVQEMEQTPYSSALGVGIAQVFALFPGVSRSGATIMGGLLSGMTRKAATEFSFFLAIPTMFAATIFDLSEYSEELTRSDIGILAVGFVSAFVSALWVVHWLIRFVSHNDFKPFAYYRIIFGTILLLFYYFH